MAKGTPEQQSGGDGSLDFLWIAAFVLGAVILSWYLGRTYIAAAILQVRLYEIIAINYVLNLFSNVISFTGLSLPQVGFDELVVHIKNNIGSSDVSFNSLVAVSSHIGNYLKYPITILIAGGAAWLYFGGFSYRFRNNYNTKLFKKLEKENWPQIAPVADLDLVNTKLDDEPWGVALSPVAFCKKNNLVDIEKKRDGYNLILRRGATYRVLSLQLGPRWSGVNVLPMHIKALFTIFAARMNDDKDTSDALLDQISASAAGGKANFVGVEKFLRKYANTAKTAKVIGAHGYVTTILASMLVRAREVGVLASSEFIWLKPIDRRMWYMLNTVGRPTAVAEICGTYAHWLAEKRLGLALTVPMVEEGVKGLELALSEIIYKPEEV